MKSHKLLYFHECFPLIDGMKLFRGAVFNGQNKVLPRISINTFLYPLVKSLEMHLDSPCLEVSSQHHVNIFQLHVVVFLNFVRVCINMTEA